MPRPAFIRRALKWPLVEALKPVGRPLVQWMAIQRGYHYELKSNSSVSHSAITSPAHSERSNQLRAFFESRTKGRGISKWDHYFEIYDQHFRHFRGADVHVLEIGVDSGGSLDMWRDYFGPHACIYGVDIKPACKVFEAPGVKIFIGDQEDRSFWRQFKREVLDLDIVIDDGGHQYKQQVASLEELLPHLRAGGVYICEDIHGSFNYFACYAQGLINKLNAWSPDLTCTPFQAEISSVHSYPYVTVIEKHRSVPKFRAEKHGTEWFPRRPPRPLPPPSRIS